MKYYFCACHLIFIISIYSCRTPNNDKVEWAIAIHGGAGAIKKDQITAEQDSAYRQALSDALTVGENILQNGGTALDAVEKTIIYLEDCPLFNAGRGSVFSYAGKNEMDASIMEGKDLKAGAAGSVKNIKNPIRLARAIMDKSPHVFLVSDGAEQFAIEHQIDTINASWFFTQKRWDQLIKLKEKLGQSVDSLQAKEKTRADKFGTVGCVVLDKQGNLAAGTSTGGMTNKRWNRLGDSPVIGAGTYADNNCCAVSCTGHGEYFIRYAVAHELCAIIYHTNNNLKDAANTIIEGRLKTAGGEGGLIAIDNKGNIAMPFNTEGMYRASSKSGKREIKIYKED